MTDCGDLQELGLKASVCGMLRDTLEALEESFTGLTDEEARTFAFPGKNNITWCVMHCLQNLDWFCVTCQGGGKVRDDWDDDRWDYGCPTPDQSYPSVSEMRQWYSQVRDRARAQLKPATEQDLLVKRRPFGREISLASYLRMIAHTNVHIRDIWLLRGALDAEGWPQQRYPRD